MQYHKFKAKRTEIDGIKYASKKEAAYAQELRLRQKAGEVVFYLRQVGMDLPGGVRHYIDFVVFLSDGTVEFVEVKGFDAPMGKMKRKMTEELYPISITIV